MPVTLRHVGSLEYFYEPKSVKNLNLRVSSSGEIHLSAPRRYSVRAADQFVLSRAGWIEAARARIAACQDARREESEALPDPQEALALFAQVSDRIFPLFRDVLAGQKPQLRVVDVNTYWGCCYRAQKRIHLNRKLALKPLPLIEYVVLHEYCHFIYPDHQAGFWALMEKLMPDCKARRRALKS